MRTAMVAVYTLLNVDRGVPEVWGSIYDIRDLLKATISMRDGRHLTEMKMGLKEKIAVHKALDFIKTFLAYRRRYIIIVDFLEFYGGTVHYIVRNNVIVYS